MDPILAGQLAERLGALGCLKGDFELECGATALPFRHEIVLHMLFMIP
jgi:hypothetical protein